MARKFREKDASYGRSYYWRNRDKVLLVTLANKLKRRYGLSLVRWLALHRDHNGKCAVCGYREEVPRDLCVDHDHETGEVRGLLCRSCNPIVGANQDHRAYLHKALGYLRVHSVHGTPPLDGG